MFLHRFHFIISSHIHGPLVAVVVHNVANWTSFMNKSKWVDDVRAEHGNDVIVRQVSSDNTEKKAKELNVMFIETSAKAGHNVKTLLKKYWSSSWDGHFI
ncbi:uncharacterized protein MELLADRAFT_32672 [Melampsora larici-populina 98AG31]|uniref:Uncharacterized protein n=1 Tax=Melampsora larici-populina (strain 98AG31 / pathotype 3-4-7) TaxID=747676 RepID=F4R5U6_MELLP|nr:uncharacterized protein MELLADRAFT_32672 [Melampsora larici-populina 98AG31]EGG12100.1 hypothetical protein MELLADRAFT_32672 [Melampsora larici-populina 98AG31]